jgi:type IV secretory pathway TrbD component
VKIFGLVIGECRTVQMNAKVDPDLIDVKRRHQKMTARLRVLEKEAEVLKRKQSDGHL